MRRYDIVSGILLVLSIIDFALAAPVLVQEKRQAGVDVVHIPKDVITVLGKRTDEQLPKLMEQLFMGKTEESAGAHASSSSAPPGPGHVSTDVAQAPEPNPASSEPWSTHWQPPSPTPSGSSMQAWPDSPEGHWTDKEMLFTPGPSGGDHEGAFESNPKSATGDDFVWNYLDKTDPRPSSPKSEADEYHDLYPLPESTGPMNPVHPEPSEPGPSNPKPSDPGPSYGGHSYPGEYPSNLGPSNLVSSGSSHSGRPEYPHSDGGLQHAYRPLPSVNWGHDVNLPESFSQTPTETYSYAYPGSAPRPASTDFEPQSSSADSPSQPEDPEAAARYAAKGKAKVIRRNSGTARDVGNAAQRELQADLRRAEKSLDPGE